MKYTRLYLTAILACLLASACGFVTESDFIPGNFGDPTVPAVVASPADGSKVDTLAQIDLAFSEAVSGADILGNYALSGTGVGTLTIGSVSSVGGDSYRLLLSGTPGDGTIILTISNVSDAMGSALAANTVTYTGWWNTAWQYRRKLTFNNSAQATDLGSFPVLIRLSGSRISYAATQGSGQDIRFLDPDRTVLSHEIEEWNESGDSLVWVKVPQIDGGSATDFIWMYYGNGSVGDGQDAQNVWDDNFMLVWHLSDSPTASVGDYDLNDSAKNTPLPNYGNGISTNMDASNRVSGVNAKIAGGIAFNGTDEWINLDSPNPGFYHDAFTTKTCEAWIRCNNPASGVAQDIFEEGGGTNGMVFGVQSSLIRVVTRSGGAGSEKVVNASYTDTANYFYFVGVFNNGTLSLYVDGSPAGSIATGYSGGSVAAHTGEPGFGRTPDGDADGNGSNSSHFNGFMDEVRMSDSARSADWIAAQYASMNHGFISFGSQE